MRYAVITPARNEAANLARLSAAIFAQTVLPEQWIVVDNGSTDGTADVAQTLANGRGWIRILSVEGGSSAERGAPVVRALEAGIDALFREPVDIVVNVDADISFDPDYFERLLRRFADDPQLGIASGSALELEQGAWVQRHVTGTTVWGASRAFRWQCLQQVLPFEPRMAWDGVDEFKANSLGWHTATFVDLPFRHHRPEGQRDGSAWRARRNQGEAAHYLGYRSWYLLARSLWQARRGPAALGMVWGYAGAALSRKPRLEDPAARAYLRRQQSIRRLPLRAGEAIGRRRRTAS